ncbi:MAG: hypothetical protein IT499_15340 [Rubrivivax sp.]|nr:hypothetical protein [Rubrivivax sp.]MCL4699081.1 hypothetical protein [Burkholderiaceae bacterium]
MTLLQRFLRLKFFRTRLAMLCPESARLVTARLEARCLGGRACGWRATCCCAPPARAWSGR